MSEAERALFDEVHRRLLRAYDVDVWHWHPETPPLLVCLGAILVQHTAWTNVETALRRLQDAGISSIEAVAALPEDELASLIRPAGTPQTKARRLQTFAAFVLTQGGFEGLFDRPEAELRTLLLSTPGIGPETADVILLYAANTPAVVSDAYTMRLFRRIGLGPARDRYDDWRTWLDAILPPDRTSRRHSHAAIVMHGKTLCRVRPLCTACPMLDLCAFGRSIVQSL